MTANALADPSLLGMAAILCKINPAPLGSDCPATS
jgi:hypothetical protein